MIRRMISSIPKTLLAEVLSVVFFLVHMILVRLFIAHGRQRSTVNWQRSGKHPGPNRHPQARHFIRRPGRCLLQTPQRARAIALCWMLPNNLVRFEAFSRAIWFTHMYIYAQHHIQRRRSHEVSCQHCCCMNWHAQWCTEPACIYLGTSSDMISVKIPDNSLPVQGLQLLGALSRYVQFFAAIM